MGRLSASSITMLYFDLDGSVDIGATTRLEGQPHAPVGVVSQFFHRGTNRGDQFRGEYQKLYDDGIQVALKHLGNRNFSTRAGRVASDLDAPLAHLPAPPSAALWQANNV